jgi:hypothetical protein
MIHVQTLFFLQGSSARPLHLHGNVLSAASLASLAASLVAGASGGASVFGGVAVAEFSAGGTEAVGGSCAAAMVEIASSEIAPATAARIAQQIHRATKVISDC